MALPPWQHTLTFQHLRFHLCAVCYSCLCWFKGCVCLWLLAVCGIQQCTTVHMLHAPLQQLRGLSDTISSELW